MKTRMYFVHINICMSPYIDRSLFMYVLYILNDPPPMLKLLRAFTKSHEHDLVHISIDNSVIKMEESWPTCDLNRSLLQNRILSISNK